MPQSEPQIETTCMCLFYSSLPADYKIPFFHAHTIIRLILSPNIIVQWLGLLLPDLLSGSTHSNISQDGQYLEILCCLSKCQYSRSLRISLHRSGGTETMLQFFEKNFIMVMNSVFVGWMKTVTVHFLLNTHIHVNTEPSTNHVWNCKHKKSSIYYVHKKALNVTDILYYV